MGTSASRPESPEFLSNRLGKNTIKPIPEGASESTFNRPAATHQHPRVPMLPDSNDPILPEATPTTQLSASLLVNAQRQIGGERKQSQSAQVQAHSLERERLAPEVRLANS